MGMANYGVHEFGLMLYENDVEEYALKNGLVEDAIFQNNLGLVELSSFEGIFNDDTIERDHFYFLNLEKYPTLYKKAYENKEQAIEELRLLGVRV